ncbi:hypothetical protein GPROT1_00140 [Gammaproteobacteria bacterium]|nr:hypothetical protein GPROT1_00140 [Gammaproteobacteria bacterium]
MTTLESRLRVEGIACRVEARDRLAILVPDAGQPVVLRGEIRQRVLAVAREEGFTHVTLDTRGGSAALPRD